MTYHLKSRDGEKHTRGVRFALGFLVVACLSVYFLSRPARAIFTYLSQPVWYIGSGVARSYHTVGNLLTRQVTLAQENELLKTQVSTLTAQLKEYDYLVAKNDDLSKELALVGTNHLSSFPVLSLPPRSPYDTFVIRNVHQPEVGDRVYGSLGSLVGLVEEVGNKTSIVTLFSKNGVSTMTTLARTGAAFNLIGAGGGTMRVMVPKDTDILWGDVFEYPGYAHVVVGSVYYIDNPKDGAFKTIYIRLPINIFETKNVFLETQ